MASTQASISFGIYDLTAKERAVYSGTGLQAHTDYEVLRATAFEPPLYATCELNAWRLDGTHSAPPSTLAAGEWGILSASASGDNGAVPTASLTASFDDPHTSAGLTLHGDMAMRAWASRVRVTWYGQTGNILRVGEYSPNRVSFFVSETAENYYGIKIEFLETNKPGMFSRLNRLDYGLLHVFDEYHMQGANVVEEMSPVCEALIESQLNFTAISRDADFNILNPAGVFAALQTGQRMAATVAVDGIDKPMGTYYLMEWKSESDVRATFKCVDVIGMLGSVDVPGGVYINRTLDSLVSELFAGSGLAYDVDDALDDILLSGWLPATTLREALQTVVFAAGATVGTDRTNVVRIRPLGHRSSGTIDRMRKLIGQTIEQRKRYSDIEVTSFAYRPGAEEKELAKDDFEPGDYTLTFSNPAHDISCTGAAILGQSANHVMIRVSVPGEVIITGTEYESTTALHRVASADPLAGGTRTFLRVENGTMISASTARVVAQHIYDYYGLSKRMTLRAVARDELPGYHSRAFAAETTLIAGTIVKMSTQLVGMLADLEIVGEVVDLTMVDERQRVNTFHAGVRAL